MSERVETTTPSARAALAFRPNSLEEESKRVQRGSLRITQHVRYPFTTGKSDMKALSTRRRTRTSLTRYDMAFLLEALGYGEAVSYLDTVSTS
jgi:hypothetical protein